MLTASILFFMLFLCTVRSKLYIISENTTFGIVYKCLTDNESALVWINKDKFIRNITSSYPNSFKINLSIGKKIKNSKLPNNSQNRIFDRRWEYFHPLKLDESNEEGATPGISMGTLHHILDLDDWNFLKDQGDALVKNVSYDYNLIENQSLIETYLVDTETPVNCISFFVSSNKKCNFTVSLRHTFREDNLTEPLDTVEGWTYINLCSEFTITSNTILKIETNNWDHWVVSDVILYDSDYDKREITYSSTKPINISCLEIISDSKLDFQHSEEKSNSFSCWKNVIAECIGSCKICCDGFCTRMDVKYQTINTFLSYSYLGYAIGIIIVVVVVIIALAVLIKRRKSNIYATVVYRPSKSINEPTNRTSQQPTNSLKDKHKSLTISTNERPRYEEPRKIKKTREVICLCHHQSSNESIYLTPVRKDAPIYQEIADPEGTGNNCRYSSSSETEYDEPYEILVITPPNRLDSKYRKYT